MFFKYNKNSATKRNVRNFVVFAVVMLFTTVFLSLFPEQVYAARKTKTLVITDLYPGAKIRPHYVNDYTKDDFDNASMTVNYGNSGTLTLPSGRGSIKVSFSGNTATVTLTNVDVYKKTPYLEIYAGQRTGYVASGWKTITDSGNAGLDEGIHPNPPKPNKWTDNTCDFYMGANFTADKMQVLWEPNSYELITDFNGATSTTATVETYDNWLTYDQPIDFFGSSHTLPNIARTGYTFCGWYCYNADWSEVMLWDKYGVPQKNVKISGEQWSDENGNYKWPNGGTQTYAKWIPNTYTVSYDGNASGVTNVPSAQNFLFNSDTRLSQQVPIRTGYSFVCWKYGSTTFNPGDYIPKDWGNFTLYAQWEPISYSITYDLQGGSFANGYDTIITGDDWYAYWRNPTNLPCRDIQINKPTGLTAPYVNSSMFHIEIPTRAGYTFTGWTITGMDNTEHSYWNGSEYIVTCTSANTKKDWGNAGITAYKNLRATAGTVKFTATWERNTYTATFIANDGVFSDGKDTKSISYDKTQTLKAPETPTRTGYTFVGWKVTANEGNWTVGTVYITNNLANKTGYYGNVTVIFLSVMKNEYEATFYRLFKVYFFSL